MGQKYAAFDAQGNITAFYDDAISPVPNGLPAIPLTDDQWMACVTQQGGYIVRDGALTDAAPPDPSSELTGAKEKVKASICATRDALLLQIPFEGKLFQTDTNSKIQIMVLSGQPALLPSASKWRTADNTYADMTLDSFKQLIAAIITREGAAFTHSAALQDAVDALTTVDAVNSFDFSGGWPE